MTVRPYLVNGDWRTGDGTFEVKNPFDDSLVAEIAIPTSDDVEEATATAAATFEESRHLSVAARSTALDHISQRLAETLDENAELIAAEGGKPLKWARVEAAPGGFPLRGGKSRSSGRASRRLGPSPPSGGRPRRFATARTR